MLSLRQITKNYEVGGQSVPALRGIDLAFRESEFVSILGPSGCGKTTLLNLIGGLDQYTSGDLMINGRSTRQFTDRDWDAYRNHSIGFVFQSYNLIPHQSVLANVELALTLSGVSKAERRRRAADALRRVGLGDQLHKKPNQMSGGQMQRVAIARALVNDPDILLADEPTGALDSETSVQVMELLREIAHDRLIIMVTHNPELAQRYSTRLIRLLDGRVVDDSAPYAPAEAELQPKKSQPKPKKAKTGMSFFTALSLSANNLLTKKARTFLTSFAGSIGIIGIALILSVSAGVNAYIESVQRDTLSSYPIEIEAETVDYTALIQSMMEAPSDASDAHERDAVYSSNVMAQLMNSMTGSSMQRNDLKRFKQAMESGELGDLTANASAIRYKYDLELPIYVKDSDGSTVRADVADVMAMMYGDSASMMQQYSGGSMSMWEELLPGADGESVNSLLTGQYDVVYGRWPESYDEIVLVLNERNEVSDLGLYALGLKTKSEMQAQVDAIRRGEPMDDTQRRWSYEEICAQTVKLVPSPDFYQKGADGRYTDLTQSETGRDYLYENGLALRVVGIIRPNEDAAASMMTGSVGYTAALTQYLIDHAAESDAVAAQKAAPDTDILSGLPFRTDADDARSDAEKAAQFAAWAAARTDAEKAALAVTLAGTPDDATLDAMVAQTIGNATRAQLQAQLIASAAESTGMTAEALTAYFDAMDDDAFMAYVQKAVREQAAAQYAESARAQLQSRSTAELAAMLDAQVAQADDAQRAAWYDLCADQMFADGTYDARLRSLGVVDPAQPAAVQLYADSFEAKDAIADAIDAYNRAQSDESAQLRYTDYVALLMSSITTILNAISYVLIAFVAISLVVSSIMIGIITYISVLERTKEIGILRAIGASKRDIARVFNAEALIIGFAAGALGIGITVLLNGVINLILHRLTGIATLNAVLPALGAGILVALSMFLTFIAGLVPSRIAARKDPVIALGSE